MLRLVTIPAGAPATPVAPAEPLEYALAYSVFGFSVIPIRGYYYAGDGPDRLKSGKKPLVDWIEFQKRQPTEEELRGWWSRWPKAAVGIVTGQVSGIAVVDLDSQEAFAWAESQGILNTPLVKTGRGHHAYYRFPEGGVRNSVDGSVKIDVRGEGGYVLAPPSIHPSGAIYSWLDGKTPADIAMREFPVGLLNKAKSRDSAEAKTELLRGLWEGIAEHDGRNDALSRLCGSWLNHRLSKAECLQNAFVWNVRNNPPLSEREVESVVSSVFRYKTDPRAEGRIEFRHRAAALLLSLWPQHGRVAVEAAPALDAGAAKDREAVEYDWNAGIRVLLDSSSTLRLAAAAEYLRTGRAQEKAPWPLWGRKLDSNEHRAFSCWVGPRGENVVLAVNPKKEVWLDVRVGERRYGTHMDYGDLYKLEAFLGVAGRTIVFGPPAFHGIGGADQDAGI